VKTRHVKVIGGAGPTRRRATSSARIRSTVYNAGRKVDSTTTKVYIYEKWLTLPG
jgi:hypothetical protein